jgi:hypothetical protein
LHLLSFVAGCKLCAMQAVRNRSIDVMIIRILGWIARTAAGLRKLAPYAAIGLLVPGGSLIAVLLWFHRRRQVTVLQ